MQSTHIAMPKRHLQLLGARTRGTSERVGRPTTKKRLITHGHMSERPMPPAVSCQQNLNCHGITLLEAIMKILCSLLVGAAMLSGCVSSSSPPPPAKTTVVVPPTSTTTTVVCQDGTRPPCN
jgi:hypothetical protein